MRGESVYAVLTGPLERFRSDFHSRYPEPLPSLSLSLSPVQPVELVTAPDAEPTPRFAKLPPEIGMLLIVVGTAGVLLPGPVGSPFLVAGGVALWPAGFRKVEGWLMKYAPKMYDEGVRQMENFLADLERRYPGSVSSSSAGLE